MLDVRRSTNCGKFVFWDNLINYRLSTLVIPLMFNRIKNKRQDPCKILNKYSKTLTNVI